MLKIPFQEDSSYHLLKSSIICNISVVMGLIMVLAMPSETKEFNQKDLNKEQSDNNTVFHSDLDQYPIVGVSFNNSKDFSLCTINDVDFSIQGVYDYFAIDYEKETPIDLSIFINFTKVFNLGKNLSFILAYNTSNGHLIMASSLATITDSDSRRLTYRFADWGAQLGNLGPKGGDSILVYRGENSKLTKGGISQFILYNNGTSDPESKKSLLSFAVNHSTGCIVTGSIEAFEDFTAEGKRIYMVSDMLTFIKESNLIIGTLGAEGKVEVVYSYDLMKIGIDLKDFQMLGDQDTSILLVESHFGIDNLIVSTAQNFMGAGAVRNIYTCPTGTSMLILPTFNSTTVIQCVNSTDGSVSLAYFLGGKRFADYSVRELPGINFTSPILIADQNEDVVYSTSLDRDIYYSFKESKINGFYNYSAYSNEIFIIGFLFSESASTDLNNSGVLFGYSLSKGVVDAVQLEKFDFYSQQIGYQVNCTLPNTTSYTMAFNVTTLLNNEYEIYFTYTYKNKTDTSMLKSVMIGVTILLTIILIMGSFWLMSRRNKEEDVVLEEFKIDYIKYSNKKSHNDSSSLINHDIN